MNKTQKRVFILIFCIFGAIIGLNLQKTSMKLGEAQVAIKQLDDVCVVLETSNQLLQKRVEVLKQVSLDVNVVLSRQEALKIKHKRLIALTEAIRIKLERLASEFHVRELELLERIRTLKGEVVIAEEAFIVCNDWGRGLEDIIVGLEEELERCHGTHNQSETRPRVAHTESPSLLSPDERLDCGGNAR